MRSLARSGLKSRTSAYSASLTFGRVALGWIAERVGTARWLRAASFGALAVLLYLATTPQPVR